MIERTNRSEPAPVAPQSSRGPRPALAVAVLGFFVVTLDALVA
jgi:hypothetical protein